MTYLCLSRLTHHASSCFLLLLSLVAILLAAQSSAFDVIEIPGPNLESAIREKLQLPTDTSITKQDMEKLTELSAWNSNISDLTGIEHAIYLEHLALRGNQIRDLTPVERLIHLKLLTLTRNPLRDIKPLANLTNLRILRLEKTGISDISPLVNLINLKDLYLDTNNIADISPLANLVRLKRLSLYQNLIEDFTPLQGLNLVELEYDEVCDLAPLLPSAMERIESRTFPSIFQAWDDVVGLDHLTLEQRKVLHDLRWDVKFDHAIQWNLVASAPTEALTTSLAGVIPRALEVRQQQLAQNPNMIFLRGIGLPSGHVREDELAPESNVWVRDENGEVVRKPDGSPLIDFVNPEVQDIFIKRIIAIAQCGLYDGVFLDEFNHNGTGFSHRRLSPYTDEEMIQAHINIFRTARKFIRDDFLIVVNANRSKLTRLSEYVNGTFMENRTDYHHRYTHELYGYTHRGLAEIESTLLWSEKNLRAPQINCLEGMGIPTESPHSPNNQRRMRLFTTMSLTLSDGYVMYNTGKAGMYLPNHNYKLAPGHEHAWYSFWDADLGRSVGTKAQHHQNIEGLFIREFTNGWAVYNRSGNAQTITLPASTTSVSDRGNNAASPTHLLPDLDGEIYLKAKNPADVNGDWVVDVLDLVQVANGLGQSTPDPNGDGVVNILDLVFVAQQFSE